MSREARPPLPAVPFSRSPDGFAHDSALGSLPKPTIILVTFSRA